MAFTHMFTNCFVWWYTLVVMSSVIGGVMTLAFETTPQQRVTYRAPAACSPRPSYCKAVIFRSETREETFLEPWSCLPEKCPKDNANNYSAGFSGYQKIEANLTGDEYYYAFDKGAKGVYCLKVFNLTWTIKPQDLILPLVGFQVTITRNVPSRDDYSVLTYKFHIDRQKLLKDEQGNVIFFFDCLRLKTASVYKFDLYSIHKEPSNESINEIGTLTHATDCDIYPEVDFDKNPFWNGSISITQSDDNSTITVFFSPLPHTHQIESYEVWLMHPNRSTVKTDRLHFKCNDNGPVLFKRVCATSYQIRVLAFGGKCSCTDCNRCGIYKNFTVTGSPYSCDTDVLVEVPSIRTTPLVHGSTLLVVSSFISSGNVSDTVEFGFPRTMLASMPSTTNPKDQNGTKDNIVLVAGCVFSTVLLLIIVLFLTWIYKSRIKFRLPTSFSGKTNHTDVAEISIAPKSVLLIYSTDNKYHSDVVHCLASYLKTQCGCDIRFDQWSHDEISQISALDWVLRQIRSVDNIIVINSEGAFRQCEAEMMDIAFEKTKHETPLEDMFVHAIKELRNEYLYKQRKLKLFKVVFPYTESKHVINNLQTGITYQLMSHIEDLVCAIHGLSKYTLTGKMIPTDINHQNYMKNQEGHDLEIAIKSAVEFFSSTPKWFSHLYQPKPWKTDHYDNIQDYTGVACNPDYSPNLDSGLGMEMRHTFMQPEKQIIEFEPPCFEDDTASLTSSYLQILNDEFVDD